MDLLLLIPDGKLHYLYITDFNRFMFKNNKKTWICKNCLQCFIGKNSLIKHKEDCMSINGVQSLGIEQGIIEFQNYFKQLQVLFKIYADFECNLEIIEIYEGSYTKNIMITLLVALLTKFYVLMIHLVSQLLFIEVKMQLMSLLKQFLTRISAAKK